MAEVDLRWMTFSGRRGEDFRVFVAAESEVEFELIEAAALPPGGNAGTRLPPEQPFSLVFRGPMTPILPQQIHALRHETIGNFDLFLVPIGPDGVGQRYQAIFN